MVPAMGLVDEVFSGTPEPPPFGMAHQVPPSGSSNFLSAASTTQHTHPTSTFDHSLPASTLKRKRAPSARDIGSFCLPDKSKSPRNFFATDHHDADDTPPASACDNWAWVDDILPPQLSSLSAFPLGQGHGDAVPHPPPARTRDAPSSNLSTSSSISDLCTCSSVGVCGTASDSTGESGSADPLDPVEPDGWGWFVDEEESSPSKGGVLRLSSRGPDEPSSLHQHPPATTPATAGTAPMSHQRCRLHHEEPRPMPFPVPSWTGAE